MAKSTYDDTPSECLCCARLTAGDDEDSVTNFPTAPIYGPHSAEYAPVLVQSKSGLLKPFKVCTNHIQFYQSPMWKHFPIESEEANGT